MEAEIIAKFEAESSNEIWEILGEIRHLLNAKAKKVIDVHAKFQERLF